MLQFSIKRRADIAKHGSGRRDIAADQAALTDQAAEPALVDLAGGEDNVALILIERVIGLGVEVDRGACVAGDREPRGVAQAGKVTAVGRAAGISADGG